MGLSNKHSTAHLLEMSTLCFLNQNSRIRTVRNDLYSLFPRVFNVRTISKEDKFCVRVPREVSILLISKTFDVAIKGRKYNESITLPSTPKTLSKAPVDQEVFAATILGLGMWRLRPIVRPKMSAFVARIEGVIRQCCMDDDLDVGATSPFEYWDTLDPTGEYDNVDPFFAIDTPNPVRSQPGYPRLQIENRVYTSRVFRKIHMEVAIRQDGLQVFHMVMYPRLIYDVPILCMDVVANDDRICLAIADTSPVRWDKSLPGFYSNAIQKLRNRLSASQALPEWGQEIFSPLCVCLRPISTDETYQFIRYACSITRLHLEISRLMYPIESSMAERAMEISACHRRFCDNQLKNEKTRRVLGASFGKSKADKYMAGFMFDMSSVPLAIGHCARE